jgi:ubiquitin C-terminal hydrolase
MFMILTLASDPLVRASSVSENGSTNNFGVGGLVNLGNTCYLNAQLQCIYHIPKARDLIIHSQSQQQQQQQQPKQDSQKQAQTQAMLGLAHVFSNMQQNNSPSSSTSTSTPTTTRVLCQVLGINPYEQQDSQEFWKLLLPELKSTPLVDLYQGAYEDYVAALDGSGRERRREEPFLDLSLDISRFVHT